MRPARTGCGEVDAMSVPVFPRSESVNKASYLVRRGGRDVSSLRLRDVLASPRSRTGCGEVDAMSVTADHNERRVQRTRTGCGEVDAMPGNQ